MTASAPASTDLPELNPCSFLDSRDDSAAVLRLQAAFEQAPHPMLIVDDRRRWVTANTAARDLLNIAREEVPWRTMDEFTPRGERRRLEQRWESFLATGVADGCYRLYFPHRGAVSMEFSATANGLLPARHLSVVIPHHKISTEQTTSVATGETAWTPVVAEVGARLVLTQREREIMTMIASGARTAQMAGCLFLSPETIKSHVANALGKLGAHTRAHAVAIALTTEQIALDA